MSKFPSLQRTTFLFVSLAAGVGLNAEPGSNKWSYATGAPLLSSPALSAGGVLYFGSYDENLYAVNSSDGSFRWKFSVKPTRTNQAAYVHSSPAVAADGTIYFGTEERHWLSPGAGSGTLYALNPNGTRKWGYAVGGAIYSDPAIGPDGTIYFGAYDTNLYGLNPDGTLKWKFPTGGGIFSDPVIAADGTVYFGCDDGNLYALTSAGTLKWAFPVGSAISASPAIAADGTVLIGTAGSNRFYGINPNGSEKWVFQAAGTIHSSAAVGANGTIYFGSNDGNLYALHPTGTLKWNYDCGSEVKSSPALAADGTIYVGCYDGKLYAVSAAGSYRWSASTSDYIYGSPVIASDGSVFVTSADNSLYAVEGSSGLAEAPWPMFRHDPLHNARMPQGSSTTNEPPIVSLTAPASGASFQPTDSITMSATATDDGSVSKVEFFANGNLLGTDTTAPYSISTTLSAGSYSITAKATDNLGLSTTSSAVSIAVTEPTGEPPSISRIERNATTVIIDATAADGTVLILQASADMSGWETAGTGTVQAGSITFTQPLETSHRFYRVSAE